MRLIAIVLLCHFYFASFSQTNTGFIPYRRDSLWGFADASGKLVVQPQYQMAGYFTGGLAKVKTAKGYQLMDAKGKLLPGVFGEIGGFSEGYRVASNESKQCGYVDASGKWIIQPA